jgi:drug/metabolite transporter (DMT)-like permease
VLEAHFLFDETLGLLSIGGMLICVVGVIIVNRPAKMERQIVS